MTQKENVCLSCTFRTANGMCNRLVCVGGFGMSDRVGSDYKKGNVCAYFKKGNSSHRTELKHTCNRSFS